MNHQRKSHIEELESGELRKHRRAENWKKFKDWLADLKTYFSLWSGLIRKVEGRYGTANASFFRFARWITVSNFIGALIW